MKKNKSWIILITLFVLFGGIPLLCFVIFIYFFIKLGSKTNIKVNESSINPVNEINDTNTNTNNIVLKCAKCGSVMTVNHKFCTNCGEPFSGDNVKVEMDPNAKTIAQQKTIITPSNFDSMFSLSEDKMVEEFINRELVKAGIDKNSNLVPSDVLKRKRIFNIIFAVLVFIYITLIFFHFPLLTYVIGLIILIIFFKLTRGYDLMKYLKKQLKARPSEKISNIVMNVKTTSIENTSKNILLPGILVAIALPLIIFINPVILYEKIDGGYGVRYYIFGLTNFTTATIPETYKNEKVISLRGNTFSNMPFLKEVNLPNTILEIRGQAFKNNRSLKTIKLPSSLNYLGGGAFYNCTSLTHIEIPDTVTYIGGEAFYNARSLKSIKLSNNLTEIRGNTFENCSSLESIIIPDSVTRIGGHAFYGNRSLSSVTISKNSKLTEIGSSAFRRCTSLSEITLPKGVSVNYRAFKESPTSIKEYGNFNTSEDSSLSHKYETFIHMYIGETKEINEYRTNANIQNAYITLESINKNNNMYEFNFKYNDSIVVGTFTLTYQNPYKVISDNLIIEIKDNYVFKSYDNRVSIYAYYN